MFGGAALGAVAADFEPGDDNVEAAIPLDLSLQSIKEVAFKFRNLAAAQTRHVDMVPLRAPFIEMFLALHMHQVEFVNQSVPLQQAQSAINRDPVYLGIDAGAPAAATDWRPDAVWLFPPRSESCGVVGHTQPARHQFGL